MSTRRTEEDFAREVEAHVALEQDRLVSEGVPDEEAHLLARRRFGSIAAAQERFYESRRFMWCDQLTQISGRVPARSGGTRWPAQSP